MTKLEKIEREITALPASDVHKLGKWLDELRAQLWDAQIEADAKAGKLDKLVADAKAELAAGKARPL